ILFLVQRSTTRLDSFVSPIMQQRLVQQTSGLRRWLVVILLLLSLGSMVVALMRPQWGMSVREMQQSGAQIMICLDVSKSMLAEDTAPNRLERAKAEISDLLGYLDGDHVGLIAFAGKATVLCPITTDFGFLKMVLDDADPRSVGLGGTRLEEPIRKAVAGFSTAGDVSRVILLITDGEDHDSHVNDAAREASEHGVRMITVGFGSELGSRIYVTDPRTGAREIVRDRAGQPVISRLDGKLLRDLAAATEGIYIPAGDGSLDLQSIYDVHIAPLVRNAGETKLEVVRSEAFQWPVLFALLLLLMAGVAHATGERHVIAAAVAATDTREHRAIEGKRQPGVKPASVTTSVTTVAMIALSSVGLIDGQNVVAQTTPAASTDASATAADSEVSATPNEIAETSETQAADDTVAPSLDQRDSRELYNDALPKLDNDLAGAEQFLTTARRNAGTDGELRFRPSFNLGWVAIKNADRLLESEPQSALEQLYEAADWFREAIRLRPEDQDARYNLEV
ncbi:MAG: VWA domain-containing protein, partial [Planctomycetales bacterium]|nr:VWA domain-containing protein [Planctomycetales bacterium]